MSQPETIELLRRSWWHRKRSRLLWYRLQSLLESSSTGIWHSDALLRSVINQWRSAVKAAIKLTISLSIAEAALCVSSGHPSGLREAHYGYHRDDLHEKSSASAKSRLRREVSGTRWWTFEATEVVDLIVYRERGKHVGSKNYDIMNKYVNTLISDPSPRLILLLAPVPGFGFVSAQLKVWVKSYQSDRNVDGVEQRGLWCFCFDWKLHHRSSQIWVLLLYHFWVTWWSSHIYQQSIQSTYSYIHTSARTACTVPRSTQFRTAYFYPFFG